jgi:gluconolactonase
MISNLRSAPAKLRFTRRGARRATALAGLTVFALVLSATLSGIQGQSASAIPLSPAPEIAGVIKGGTRPQLVAQGLKGADDPVWIPNLGLVFTEPNGNRIVRLGSDGTLATFVGDLHGPLGMTFDREGRLISIQTDPGFVSIRVIWPVGREALLADRFDGLPFSRPNGITVDRKGGVYFTDPGQNPAQEAELRKTQQRLPAAVYYVPKGGAPIRVADGIARPNGIHLSRNERTIYVNDTNGPSSFAFDVLPDGRFTNRRVFATYAGRTLPLGATEGVASGADDLVVDNEGRVYSITAAGIEVFTESGRPLGVIPAACTPTGARCQALAFGGADKRTLFVAGSGVLLRLPMQAQGFTGRAK